MADAENGTEIRREAYPSRTVRAALCMYGAGKVAELRDEDIEKLLGIETSGLVKLWRSRGRCGGWEAMRLWVEEGGEDENLEQPFEPRDEKALLKESIAVAKLVLELCRESLEGGENVEFVKGKQLTARNIIEGLNRAHVIINKDAGRLLELEAGDRDERQIEEEQTQQILRRALRVMQLTPEQLEALREEFPRMLAVVSEIIPRVLPEARDGE